MLRHVDLCSGIGGFALGFQWAELSKPVLFCDIEPWSRKILNKHWPDVPIAEDVKELANDPDGLIPECDIITAGYPCQPFSVAGDRRGTEDDRHIWPEIFTIIKAKATHLGSFRKCLWPRLYGSRRSAYLIWKGQATPSGRLLFRLPLTHPTEGTEFGSSPEMWATPNTMDHLPQRSEEALKKQATTTRKGRSKPPI